MPTSSATAGGILALDLGTSLGWAWASRDACAKWPRTPLEAIANPVGTTGLFRCGTFLLGDPGVTDGEAGMSLMRWLTSHFRIFRPQWLVYEAPLPPPPKGLARPMHRGTRAARRLIGLGFLVETLAQDAGIIVREAHIATVKLHFAGSGRAGKPEMHAMAIRYGAKVNSYDAADAVGVLALSIATLIQHHEGAAPGLFRAVA